MKKAVITNSKAVRSAVERLPQGVDLRPLLNESTQAIIARKEQVLSDVAQAEDVVLRRIHKLEQEIRALAGEKMEKIKDAKKLLKAIKLRRAEVGQSICITIEDALEFVPGADLVAKKEHLLAQRKELA